MPMSKIVILTWYKKEHSGITTACKQNSIPSYQYCNTEYQATELHAAKEEHLFWKQYSFRHLIK